MMDNVVPSESADESEDGYSDYELKEMAETLMRAHEIQTDPEIMKALEPFLQKKKKAIKSISDLKRIAQEKAMESSEDPKEESSESPQDEDKEA